MQAARKAAPVKLHAQQEVPVKLHGHHLAVDRAVARLALARLEGLVVQTVAPAPVRQCVGKAAQEHPAVRLVLAARVPPEVLEVQVVMAATTAVKAVAAADAVVVDAAAVAMAAAVADPARTNAKRPKTTKKRLSRSKAKFLQCLPEPCSV